MLIAGFDSWFGLSGVAWLYGTAIVILAAVLMVACLHHTTLSAAAIVTSLALLGAAGSLTPRPQLVSFILTTVTVATLLRTAADGRPRWLLAPMTGVWGCMHGMWFLSPALQAVVLVGLALDRRLDPRRAWQLILLALATLAAVALTPNGWYTLTHPIGDPAFRAAGKYIEEFERPEWNSPYVLAVVLMIVGAILLHVRRDTMTWVTGLLLLSAAAISTTAARSVAVGAVIAAPLLAAALSSRKHGPTRRELAVVHTVPVVVAIGLALVILDNPSRPSDSLPTAFDSALAALPEESVLFNELGDGGYLTWRHPDLKIVGDGLTDQYTPPWIIGWLEALHNQPGQDAFLARTGADHALLYSNSPFAERLTNGGWQLLAEGGGRYLLVREP